jgi:aminomethyltransferase
VTKINNSSLLQRTPLYELSVAQKARFTPFAGWEMAVQYEGLKQEHDTVRNGVGMFDISHMGKFALTGKNLKAQLQLLIPSDLEQIKVGQAQYSVFLNENGGIIDDIIYYDQGFNAQGEEQGILIVNAETKDQDQKWLFKHLDLNMINFQDLSASQVLIAVQGSSACEILNQFVSDDLTPLTAFAHVTTTLFDQPAFFARTGYTGEDGFEIMTDHETGKQLWQSLLEQGVKPCGLGARDTLRLEAAMCLYGQDIDETTTPLEAGLKWLVHLDRKGDFIGRNILEKQLTEGVKRRLVGLKMDGKHIARHGYSVLLEGQKIGEITSGTFSPILNYGIALAYLPTALSRIGQMVEIEIRGKFYPAQVVKKPFYRSPTRLKKSK